LLEDSRELALDRFQLAKVSAFWPRPPSAAHQRLASAVEVAERMAVCTRDAVLVVSPMC
jgi:hypothetical protein